MSKIYTPQPGSLAFRVLTFLVLNPDEELTRADIATKFNTTAAGVEGGLNLPVSYGVLCRVRNDDDVIVYKLGPSNNFVLDQSGPASGETIQESVRMDPPRAASSFFPTAPPPRELDLDQMLIRKGVRLMTAEERRRQEFSDWFDKFDVGDSAEFDDVHVSTIRTETARHRKAKQSSWKIASVGKGRSGVERIA